jgi:hypothetical protein
MIASGGFGLRDNSDAAALCHACLWVTQNEAKRRMPANIIHTCTSIYQNTNGTVVKAGV